MYIPKKYVKVSIVDSFKVVSDYDGSSLNSVLIKGIDVPIRYCLWNCWEANQQENFFEIEFQPEFFNSPSKKLSNYSDGPLSEQQYGNEKHDKAIEQQQCQVNR